MSQSPGDRPKSPDADSAAASPGLLELLSEAVRSDSQIRRFAAGQVIVREGDRGSEAYILLAGRCEVSVHGDVVNHIEPGELFGEVGCLESGPRTATVRSEQDSELLELSADVLRGEFLRCPAFLDRFLRDITRRLRDISAREVLARDEHRNLRRVLERLQPSLDPFVNHPVLSIDARWRPLSYASGDYYDILEVSPARFLFALGDVMGHGAATTPILAMIRGQLHEWATADCHPDELLARLHRHIRRHAQANVFMTLTLMTLDLATLAVELSIAGPPAPLLFRGGTCAPMTGTFGWTLGYPFDEMAYDLHRFTLQQGDVVVFYTDGLSEATVAAASNVDARETEALSALVCEVAAAGADRIAARLFEKLESTPNASIFNDDATALALCIR